MGKQNDLHNEILKRARKWYKKQVTWRRRFHRIPELSNEELRTTAFLMNETRRLGLKLLPLKMKTGVLAELRVTRSGPTVAIRSDIDALAITEQTGLPYASRVAGRMHACGHDMHIATVLGAAAVLSEMSERPKGNIRFIFQPAEEQPPGGARPMIENGAIKDVSAIFGLHVDPHLAVGRIGLLDGQAMASVYDFDLMIAGRGGHAARPHMAVDAIVVAAEVIESLQKIVSRETDPITPLVITFGQISGGSARNAIAERVDLTCTVRTLSAKLYKRIPAMIRRTVSGICRARGADFSLKEIAGYPVLKNNPQINQLYRRNFQALFKKGGISLTEQVLGGEDFAFYLKEIPGAMFRLGIMNKKIGADKPWHSPHFVADEEAIYYGTSLLVASAYDYLNGVSK